MGCVRNRVRWATLRRFAKVGLNVNKVIIFRYRINSTVAASTLSLHRLRSVIGGPKRSKERVAASRPACQLLCFLPDAQTVRDDCQVP